MELPRDLVDLIVNHSDSQDLLAIMEVSKAFNESSNRPHLWKNAANKIDRDILKLQNYIEYLKELKKKAKKNHIATCKHTKLEHYAYVEYGYSERYDYCTECGVKF